MDTNYINNEELTMYMEDRVLEAINKIPLEEQYFLIIVLFLKFVFCYGVELTCSFIFLILAVLSKTPSKMSKYLIDAIMKSLTFLEKNLTFIENIINTRPDATEIERYLAFEDYLLILEAKLFVLLANLTCCHGEIFGKQFLTSFNDSEYEFDEKKLIELLSPDIPIHLMDNLMKEYECGNPEDCIKKMIQRINFHPEVVSGLKKIVYKQNRDTLHMIGQRVKIKYGVNYTFRYSEMNPLSGRDVIKTSTIDLSGRSVTIFRKSDLYNRLVFADGEWHIGYHDKTYNNHHITGDYVEGDRQKYIFYNKGLDQHRIFKNEDVKKNVKPMKCYLVEIPGLSYSVVLPEEAFDLTIGLNDMGRYVEDPVISDVFNNIRKVIKNVFTGQTETDRNFEDYLNNVAIKEYTTKKRLFEMLKLIFGGGQQNKRQEYDNYDDDDIDDLNALRIVAPPILEGCDVGIRYVRDTMLYLLGRFVENTPEFRDWLLRNWNNMIDSVNELLTRINLPVLNDENPENPQTGNQLVIIRNNANTNTIPHVTLEEVSLILGQPPQTRARTPPLQQGIPGERDNAREARRQEAQDFVDGMNRNSEEQYRTYNRQNAIPQNDIPPVRGQLYNDLGIGSGATQNDIKKAYHALARLWHPDNNPSEDATAKFQQISHAYTVLYDPEKRKLYDSHGIIMGGKTIKNRKGKRKGIKYNNTNKRYKKKIPKKTIKKYQKNSSGHKKMKGKKTRRKN